MDLPVVVGWACSANDNRSECMTSLSHNQEAAEEPLAEAPVVMTFPDMDHVRQLFGEHNRHLDVVAESVGLDLHARGNRVSLHGDAVAISLARNLLQQLYGLIEEGYPVYGADIDYAIRILSRDDRVQLKEIFLDTVYITSKKTQHRSQKPGPENLYRCHAPF
jgi:phosphate starvation-inducible protein PhoH